MSYSTNELNFAPESREFVRRRGVRAPRIVVAGLGNVLRRDDGVGVHAVRRMGGLLHRGVMPIEVGTAVIESLRQLERADRILAIHSMKTGRVPGTIFKCQAANTQPVLGKSGRDVSLAAAIPLMRKKPLEILFLCVEPKLTEFGLQLSPEVNQSLDDLVELATQICCHWVRS